jgi:DNA-binding winged helix-turn-helix (wHTH) protein/tetratricopeptide (TPR) repeat protein
VVDRVNGASNRRSFRVGEWVADAKGRTLARDGVVARITPLSMKVLGYLADHPGETVTHEELLAAFWRGAVSSTNAVHKCVAELRHTFGNGGGEPAYIETVPKHGYRLVAAVEPLETANGNHRLKNGANGSLDADASIESGIEAEGPVNEIAKVQWNSRRLGIALALLAAIVLVSAFALFRANSVDAFVIKIGDRSAVLLPGDSRSPPSERRSLDVIRDKVIGQLRATGRAEVSTMHRSGWFRETDEVARAWNVDYAVQIELAETADLLRASLSIVPANSDDPTHREQFDAPIADRSTLLDTLASHTTSDLEVLLDKQTVAQMRASGTANVDAFRYACDGITFVRVPTAESLARGEEKFRLSIAADPRFGGAYASLAWVYAQLAQDAADSATNELQRKKLLALLSEATIARIDQASLGEIDQAASYASISSAFDAERHWHAELRKNPTNAFALTYYAELLIGSKLIDESQRYIERALGQRISVEAEANIKSRYGALAEARGNFEEQVRLNKEFLDVMRDSTVAQYGTVRSLAQLGRFQEAEAYIDHLNSSAPPWGSAARDVLLALRGDTPANSAALRATVEDPQKSNALKTQICFMVGDVECGVRSLRRIEPTFLRLYWTYAPCDESHYSRSVIDDPRYQAVLEELGIGRTWRAYMRQQAQELASVTGIQVTTPPPPEDMPPSANALSKAPSTIL